MTETARTDESPPTTSEMAREIRIAIAEIQASGMTLSQQRIAACKMLRRKLDGLSLTHAFAIALVLFGDQR